MENNKNIASDNFVKEGFFKNIPQSRGKLLPTLRKVTIHTQRYSG